VWKLQNLDAEHFEALQEKIDDTPPPADITGAPVKKTWLFKPTKAGKSELRFIHYRPWEGEKSASDTFFLRVLIIP
jgi:predicted secreted protein